MQPNNLVVEIDKIFTELKRKNYTTQIEAAKNLQSFMISHIDQSDEVFFRLQELSKSNEKHEIVGFFHAINRIVKAIRETQTPQFVLRFLPSVFQQLNSTDVEIIEKAAQCFGTLVKLIGPHSSESIEGQIKTALSWLRSAEGVFDSRQAENRKYAAVLVLKDFCLYVPVVTFSNITSGAKEPLKEILATVREPKPAVREAAFELIKTLLKLINNREDTTKKELYLQIYYKAKADLGSSDINPLQGSLLIIEALLTHCPPEYIGADQYGEICESVFKSKDNKNIQIKKAIVALIPKLAAFSIATFVTKYLQLSMQYIVEFITKKGTKEKGAGFLSLGQLCKIMPKEKFGSQISIVWKLVEEEVIKNKCNFCPEALDCVQMACSTYGAEFLHYVNVHVFIDHLFYSGLNERLIAALKQIMMIPGCEKEFLMSIQIRLLNAISVILTSKSFNFSGYLLKEKSAPPNAPLLPIFPRPPILTPTKSGVDINSGKATTGSLVLSPGETLLAKSQPLEETKDDDSRNSARKKSKGLTGQTTQENISAPASSDQEIPSIILSKETIKKYSQKVVEAVQTNIEGLRLQNEEVRAGMIILALRTLSSFDFAEFSECLVQFVLDYVLEYLEDENSEIRKATIKTGCCLYVKNDKAIYFGKLDRVNEIVKRFLIVSLTDPDTKIRCKMLKYLNHRLDYVLSQKTNLKLLFQCVQNNIFEVREHAIRILGRLSDQNPSVIQPYFRNQLVQLLSVLEYSADIKEKEESAQLLGTLMKYSGRMCETYTQPILNSLIPKLKDANYIPLIPSILSAVGQLSEVGGEIMKPKLIEIVPLIIENLKDQSNASKREIALNALSQIVESTNYAIYPYIHYPYLFKHISDLVIQETSPSLRKSILRLLGSIGALDPYKFKQIMLYTSMSESRDSDMYEGCYLLYETMLSESKKAGHYDKALSNAGDDSGLQTGAAGEKVLGMDSNNPLGGKMESLTQLHSSSKFESISQFSETYYPTVAIKALMGVLMIPTLKDHHQVVLHASKFILKSLTSDCVPYLPTIIPPILNLIKTADPIMMISLFEFLSELVRGVGEAFGEFCPAIFSVINQFIEEKKEVSHVLELIECMSHYTRSAFKSELSRILPKLLAILYEANIRPKDQINKTLSTLKEFGELLDDYLHLVILALMNLCCARETDPVHMEYKIGVLGVIKSIVKCPHFKDYLSSVVHPLVKQIEPSTYPEYGSKITNVLTHMLNILNVDFAIYLPLIQRTVMKHRILHYEFYGASGKFLRLNNVDILFDEGAAIAEPSAGPALPPTSSTPSGDPGKMIEASASDKKGPAPVAAPGANGSIAKAVRSREQKIEFTQLMREFDASKCYIREDWIEWLKKTSIELLKQNPSPIIYACSSLAQVYDPIANELYNMAFSSCWKILNDKQKEYIISNLYRAIESPTTPVIVYQTILNLAEFMEHEENALPMLTSTLGSLAEKCNALAKALYYREIEFESNPTNVIEALISINYGLQQPEAANGILQYAENNLNMKKKEEWYQKLHRWNDALREYQAKLVKSSKAEDAIIGEMQCYKALSDWESLAKITEEIWAQQRFQEKNGAFYVSDIAQLRSPAQPSPVITYSPSPQISAQANDSSGTSSPSHVPVEAEGVRIDLASLKAKIAEMAAAAAWNLGKWEKLEEYNKAIEPGAYESLFYESVLCIHKGLYDEARDFIEKAREVLDTKITSLINESYSRAYSTIVDLQHLKELEEVITYKLSEGNLRKRQNLDLLWRTRLTHAQKDIDLWQKSLAIRSLVKTKIEDVDIYIKYANLSRKNGRHAQCLRILEPLRKDIVEKFPERVNDIAKVEFALMKCMYEHGNSKEVYQQLKRMITTGEAGIDNKLKARCFLKLGMWEKKEQDINEKKIASIIQNFYTATQLNGNFYKAWNAYGLLNYDALCKFEDPGKIKLSLSATQIKQHCLAAINGFVHAISLGGNDITKTLQNLLRLLKLWFNYGDQPEQEALIRDSFTKIDITSWLPVIPQILARIDIKSEIISKMMFDLLESIGRFEPQVLLYPLSMMAKCSSEVRKKSAAMLMDRIKQHNPVLIKDILQVCNELIRIAILLHELWYEVIKESNILFYGEENVQGGIKLLLDMHEQMKKPPETMNEISFYQMYGSKIAAAESWLRKFLISKNELDINQAWDIYRSLYFSIDVKCTQSLELRNVSPALIKMTNLSIVVPGLFKSNQRKMVTIAWFEPLLVVLETKQHPRKLTIHGSDGKDYLFLLKGHEDNRQDERAMQLFGLINTLLSTDPLTQKKDLSIRRYPVFPLSPNTGLIGWVPNCDTLNTLIKEYRTNYNIIQAIEHKLMKSMCETFTYCCLVNKVEIFRHAMDNTYGQDLYKILWLKSNNSEIWLERRTNYTRSHAVMCMVGYILGLGDRHPSNIMLDRYSGKIVHIDFGDCFEVAMKRDQFPEKVPFRLTRMLIKAMEVSGIEGNYKTTCEQTMKVLRGNKDSLLAILEAFVYDPLISFRLLTPNIDKANKAQPKFYPKPDRENILVGKSQGDERGKLDERQKDFFKKYGKEGDAAPIDKLNKAAHDVIDKIERKLNGKEFNENLPSSEEEQVIKLIKQATSDENLAQMYIGWCPYW